jgi:hypothetical protein
MKRHEKIILFAVIVGVIALTWVMTHGQTVTVTRHWTGVCDPHPDQPASRVTTYQLRWSIDSAAFFLNPASGTLVPYVGTPADSGKADSMVVGGLPSEKKVWFAIRGIDAVGNPGLWSDPFKEIQPDRTGPLKVQDLH